MTRAALKRRASKSLLLALVLFPIDCPAQTSQTFQQLSQSADRAREQSRDDDAIQLYGRALALKPDSQESLWYLATLLYAKNEFAAARDRFRMFLALRPDASAAWALLGLSEFQIREYPRALDHLQRAVAAGTGDNADLKSSAIHALGILLTRFEHYDDSLDVLFANAKNCDDPTLDAEGLAGLRLPLLPSEIPQDRHPLIPLAGQGLCAVQQGRTDDALKLFSSLETSYPNEPGVHFLLGSLLMSTRPAEGIAEMKHELEISPSNVPARNRLAEQYTKSGQIDQALILAREAKKLEPGNFSVNITLGEALIAKGESAEGIKELEAARDNVPDNIRIRLDLARAYAGVGRAEDAKREKQQLEKLNQQNGTPDAKPE